MASSSVAANAAASSASRPNQPQGCPGLPKHLTVPLDMKISFVEGDVEEFLGFLKTAVERKAWITVSREDLASEAEAAAIAAGEAEGAAVGMGRIRHQHRARLQLESSVAGEAFRDLSSLMRMAKEVAVLAQQYARTRRSTKAAAAGAGRAGAASQIVGEASSAHDDKVATAVEGLCLVNPVTREVAGDRFHRELSTQVAEFALPLMDGSGGLLPLTDLYCLYNRARGTDLVSPEDLLKACQLMEGGSRGLRLRRLASGVQVLQDSKRDEDGVAKQLVEWMGDNTEVYVSAPMLAMQLKVSIAIAQAHLLHAEKLGIVCRDEGLHGLRYFRVPPRWRPASAAGAGAGVRAGVS